MACCGDKRRSDALRAYVGTEERKNGVNRLILRGYQVFRRDFLYLCEGKDDGSCGNDDVVSRRVAERLSVFETTETGRDPLCGFHSVVHGTSVLGPNCKMG